MSNVTEILNDNKVLYVAGAGYQVFPDLAAGTSVTAGTTPAFGSWVELFRAQENTLVVGAQLGWSSSSATDWTWFAVEYGFGESAAEATVWQTKAFAVDFISASGVTTLQAQFFPRVLPVPVGTRLSCRVAASTSSLVTLVSTIFVADKDLRTM